MPNRLPHTMKGELLTSMHKLLLEKVESLGDAAAALKEAPEMLMAEKAELEQHVEKMLQEEEERQRNSSMTATRSEKERLARLLNKGVRATCPRHWTKFSPSCQFVHGTFHFLRSENFFTSRRG